MSDNELLLAISNMMDTKLKPVNEKLQKIELTQENNILPRLEKIELTQENNILPRLEKIELTQENDILPRLDKLEHSQERLEQSYEKLEQSQERLEQSYERLEQSFEKMEQSQKKMELTLENNILPRLQTIEDCYLSTFKRYQSGVGQIEKMQNDIDVIKTTITNHSEILQRLA